MENVPKSMRRPGGRMKWTRDASKFSDDQKLYLVFLACRKFIPLVKLSMDYGPNRNTIAGWISTYKKQKCFNSNGRASLLNQTSRNLIKAEVRRRTEEGNNMKLEPGKKTTHETLREFMLKQLNEQEDEMGVPRTLFLTDRQMNDQLKRCEIVVTKGLDERVANANDSRQRDRERKAEKEKKNKEKLKNLEDENGELRKKVREYEQFFRFLQEKRCLECETHFHSDIASCVNALKEKKRGRSAGSSLTDAQETEAENEFSSSIGG